MHIRVSAKAEPRDGADADCMHLSRDRGIRLRGVALGGVAWPVVLWDLDGTLIDSMTSIVSAHHAATDALSGAKLDDTAIRRRIGQSARRRIEALVPERADEFFTHYSTIIQHLRPDETPPIDGIAKLVRDLAAAGIRQVVVSSRPRRQAERTLQHFGLPRYLSSLVGLEDTEKRKPDPAPLLHAHGELSATQSHAVYVGDAVVDIGASQAASIDSIGVTWGAGAASELASAWPTRLAQSVNNLRLMLLSRITMEI